MFKITTYTLLRLVSCLPLAFAVHSSMAQDKAFLSDYSQLQEARRPTLRVYTSPDVAKLRTKKIYLAPVEIHQSSAGYQGSASERRRMASEMRRRLVQELSAAFQVVDVAAPDAMPVRVALTNVKFDTPGHYAPRLAATPYRDIKVSVNGSAPFNIFSAVLEVEAFTPHKTERLMAMVDNEPLPGNGTPVRWDRALDILSARAHGIVDGIKELQARSSAR